MPTSRLPVCSTSWPGPWPWTSADGEYTLYVGGAADQPWPAYCHDMAGTPAEYLVLVNLAEELLLAPAFHADVTAILEQTGLPPRLLRTKEAARFLGISAASGSRNWCCSGSKRSSGRWSSHSMARTAVAGSATAGGTDGHAPHVARRRRQPG